MLRINAHLTPLDIERAASTVPAFAAAAEDPLVWRRQRQKRNPDARLLGDQVIRRLSRTPVQLALHQGSHFQVSKEFQVLTAIVLGCTGVGLPVAAWMIMGDRDGRRSERTLLSGIRAETEHRVAQAAERILREPTKGEEKGSDAHAVQKAVGAVRKLAVHLDSQQRQLKVDLNRQLKAQHWLPAYKLIGYLGEGAPSGLTPKQLNTTAAAALKSHQWFVVAFFLDSGAKVPANRLQATLQKEILSSTAWRSWGPIGGGGPLACCIASLPAP